MTQHKISSNTLLWLSFTPILIALLIFPLILHLSPNTLCVIVEPEMGCMWRPWADTLRYTLLGLPWLMVSFSLIWKSQKIKWHGWIAFALLIGLYLVGAFAIIWLNHSH